MKFVFVTNEGRGLKYLKRLSEQREKFLVLADMTDEEALHYVQTACKDKLKKYDINEVKQMIRDITGGRITYLAKMILEINDGNSLEGKCYKYNILSMIFYFHKF